MDNDAARELLDAYYQSWNSGIAAFDEVRLRGILAADLRFEGPIAGKRVGMESFLVGLADFVRTLKAYQSVQQLHTGDEAASLYDCTICGAAGTLRFAEFFRLRNGKIQEIKLVYDPNEFLRLTAPTA
jgi:hypothetical protein